MTLALTASLMGQHPQPFIVARQPHQLIGDQQNPPGEAERVGTERVTGPDVKTQGTVRRPLRLELLQQVAYPQLV